MIKDDKIILGLDPGTNIMGYGIIKSQKSKLKLVQYGNINLKKYTEHGEKLKLIFNKVNELIDEYNVGGLIFGLPLSLNGEENERTNKVRDFIKKLKLLKKINIELYDERFSTDIIFKTFKKDLQTSKKIKKKIDQQAAAYILQGFLDNANINI